MCMCVCACAGPLLQHGDHTPVLTNQGPHFRQCLRPKVTSRLSAQGGEQAHAPVTCFGGKPINTSLRVRHRGCPASLLNPPLRLDRASPSLCQPPNAQGPCDPAAQPTGDLLMVPVLPEDVCAAAAGGARQGAVWAPKLPECGWRGGRDQGPASVSWALSAGKAFFKDTVTGAPALSPRQGPWPPRRCRAALQLV